MNKIMKLGGIGVFIVFLSACATMEPTWKTIPETTYSYDKAWPLIVNAVSDKFDIETIDANSGYLRTAWKTKNDFLGKPETRTRVVVKTESKSPLKFSFRAEKQNWDSVFTNSWVAKGNDTTIENDVQTEWQSRMK